MAPALSNAVSHAISADGTVIGYESVGSGPPLLLVHGSTGTRARWSTVREPLAQRYTVHAMDRRGRGLSTAEAGPYSLRREAEDVAAVAEAIGSNAGDVFVVGHSYGALASLEAALITPAFRRILLYEPPVPSPGLTGFPPDGLARINAMSDPREILDAFYRGTLQLPESAIKDLGDPAPRSSRCAARGIRGSITTRNSSSGRCLPSMHAESGNTPCFGVAGRTLSSADPRTPRLRSARVARGRSTSASRAGNAEARGCRSSAILHEAGFSPSTLPPAYPAPGCNAVRHIRCRSRRRRRRRQVRR
jgi:pimeloyl-ACP methyl ester carboxylesterase